jgi:hypothetical protein
VQQRRNVFALPVDHGRRTSAAEIADVERIAVDVGIRRELGQPIREVERRISERARERVAQIGRRKISAQLDHEVAERGLSQTSLEEAGQKDDRCECERDKRGPPDLRDPRPPIDNRQEEKRDHDEREREGIHEHGERAAQRPSCLPSTNGEHAHAGQARSAHNRELNIPYHLFRSGIRPALEQVVRTEPPEIHPNQLEPDRRPVRCHKQRPYKPSPQATVGEGEEDMQEQHGRYQVDGLPDRVRNIAR